MRLLFLGRLADVAGADNAELASADPVDWVGIMAWLGEHRSTTLAGMVAEPRIRVALNGALLADKHALKASGEDEIAFLPPVSGG